MVSFKDFYLGLSADERMAFASSVGTTVGYCNKLVYGGAKVELGLADVIVAASGGRLVHDGVPMTDRAMAQMHTRAALAEKVA